MVQTSQRDEEGETIPFAAAQLLVRFHSYP
jgi:hypothetical protein